MKGGENVSVSPGLVRVMVSAWLPVALWIVVIYYFSDQPYSGVRTERLFGALNVPIRKLAHVSEFAVLFLLSLRAFINTRSARSGAGQSAGGSSRLNPAAGAMALTLAGAVFDEWHQSYVPGRSANLSDVLVDTLGACLAFAGFSLIACLCRRRKGTAL